MIVQCFSCYRESDFDWLPDQYYWCPTCQKYGPWQYVPSQNVVLSCTKEYYDIELITGDGFLNISEGILGEDRITFMCPKCGQKHESLILG